MNSSLLHVIRDLLSKCSDEERMVVFKELRELHQIHEFEEIIGAPAETILEAVHRAPELTRRMLRGVIADAAFRSHVLPGLEPLGWRDVTPAGNFAFDYRLEDANGAVTVQVKLQRSERGLPKVAKDAVLASMRTSSLWRLKRPEQAPRVQRRRDRTAMGSSISWQCRCSLRRGIGADTCTRLGAGCCPEKARARSGLSSPCRKILMTFGRMILLLPPHGFVSGTMARICSAWPAHPRKADHRPPTIFTMLRCHPAERSPGSLPSWRCSRPAPSGNAPGSPVSVPAVL